MHLLNREIDDILSHSNWILDKKQDEEECGEKIGDKQSKGSSDGDATTGSYSSLEDDEAETVDQLAALAARYRIDNFDLGNGNKICKYKLIL